MNLNIVIILISFLATLIRSTFGFGEALVAVPLLALFLPIQVAVPLALLLSIAIASLVIIQDHQHIHVKSAKWLILSALPGIPIGLYLIIHIREGLSKAALGILICLFSIYSLLKKPHTHSKKGGWSGLIFCGLLSGILGGAYGLNGPPLVYYGDKQGWSAKHFRATLQAYFLPVSTLALIGYMLQSMVTSEVFQYFIIALPASIPAVFLGRWLNKKLNSTSFFKLVYIFLIILGVLLFYSSIK